MAFTGGQSLPDFKLFGAPNACSRVPTIALEEIGAPFETVLVRTGSGEQKSPEYLKLNPKGKVPVLVIDGEPLTENVAILSWLNQTFPEANLLPKTADPLSAIKQTGDLSFFSATVHPIVTRIAMPLKFIADKDLSFEIVRPVGEEAMQPVMRMVDDRLADGPWWYGDTWSIVDGYLYWAWCRITGVGFDDKPFDNIRRHKDMMEERPAVQRAMAREAVFVETLKSEGIYTAPR